VSGGENPEPARIRSSEHEHQGRLQRERVFHDQLAAALDPERMPAAPPGPLDAALLATARVQAGMRVLELGCGSGDLTLALLGIGAEVTAVDLSGAMIDVARRRIERYAQRPAELVVAPAERTGLAADSFDAVIGRFILHHLDIPQAAREIARVLRPGGRGAFLENSARNPLLMLARTHLAGRFGIPRLGSVDERPLGDEDIQVLRAHFAVVELSWPVFEFAALFDRQVLGFRHPTASRVCRAIDRAAGRIPALRPYSFRAIVLVSGARDHRPRS